MTFPRLPHGRSLTRLAVIVAGVALVFSCARGKVPPRSLKTIMERADRDAAEITKTLERIEQIPDALSLEEATQEEIMRRRAAIATHQRLLKRKHELHPKTYEETMFSLATLLFEDSMLQYAASMKAYEQHYERYKKGETSRPPEAPRPDYQAAREVYHTFLQTFPSSPHRAEAMYNIAYSYDEEGDLEQAVPLYHEVIRTAPEEKFATEAYMRLAEYYFETNEFTKALQHYEKVVARGDSPFYEKALFKIGWSHYAQEHFTEAKSAFAHLLELFGPGSGKKQGDLYKESLEIMAKSFSETGGVAPLEKFLEDHGHPAYGLSLFIQLGNLYKETSRYHDAIDTYVRILSRYPVAPEAPAVEQSLIECLVTEHRNERHWSPGMAPVLHGTKQTLIQRSAPKWTITSRLSLRSASSFTMVRQGRQELRINSPKQLSSTGRI